MVFGKSKDEIICPNCKDVLGTYDSRHAAWVEAKCDNCGATVVIKVQNARYPYES